eukprot:COSAG01_NODE_35665_length_528_cov_1.850816_1_plen_77_part_01
MLQGRRHRPGRQVLALDGAGVEARHAQLRLAGHHCRHATIISVCSPLPTFLYVLILVSYHDHGMNRIVGKSQRVQHT